MQRHDSPKDTDLTELPDNLPEPVDDGAADHLTGKHLPSVSLPSTAGQDVDLSIRGRRTVIYCYPLMGSPDQDDPEGWDLIPGARGCTPQSCAFRDHHEELNELGASVFGLSVQSAASQRETKERLHLPFELLSDAALEFAGVLNLPTFAIDDQTYIKRTTLIVSGGQIEKVFYPVFPPDENADEVIEWLKQHPAE